MNARSLFSELKRRRIYSVAAAYVITAWLLIQIATQVFPFFGVPNGVVRLVVLLLIVGFPVTVATVWAFESRTGAQRPAGRRLAALTIFIITLAAGVTIFRFFPSQLRNVEKTPVAGEINLHSIAVLPFDNLSTDESNAYFVSGMRDEILTSLAHFDQTLPEKSAKPGCDWPRAAGCECARGERAEGWR